MQVGAFQTSLGEIWLWGDPGRLDRETPVVLAIAGVFARNDGLIFRLQSRIPEAGVLCAQLPGNLCPELEEISLEAFAEAFGEVLQSHLGGRPVLIVGDSIGGTVALAMAAPGVRRLALDPPLQTGHLWPLREMFVTAHELRPGMRTFARNVFGFDGTGFVQIDYRPLVRGPARVLIGDIPLEPPRDWTQQPSLLGEADLRFLRDHPRVHTTLVQGVGHLIVRLEDMVVGIIREELGKAVEAWGRRTPQWFSSPEA